MTLRFKDLREDRDLTQEEVSKKINVTQAAYSFYETGKRQMDYKTLIKLAKFYNTSLDYMFGLTDEIKPYPKRILEDED